MRRHLAVASVLVALVLTSIALAAPSRIPITFQSFAASGVSGDGTINSVPSGDVQLHVSLRGLEANTTYSALIYTASQSCDEATASQQVVQFQSNPSGIATWNQKVTMDVNTISSVGIRLVSDNSLKACGAVTP